MKPIKLKVCPLCGDINQFGWFCDDERRHPGEQPMLVEEIFYSVSHLRAVLGEAPFADLLERLSSTSP